MADQPSEQTGLQRVIEIFRQEGLLVPESLLELLEAEEVPDDPRVTAALAQVATDFPCHCGAAYRARGRHFGDCAHYWAEDLVDSMLAGADSVDPLRRSPEESA